MWPSTALAGRGHALALAEQIGAEGTTVLLDLDAGNLEHGAGRLAELLKPRPHRPREFRASPSPG